MTLDWGGNDGYPENMPNELTVSRFTDVAPGSESGGSWLDANRNRALSECLGYQEWFENFQVGWDNNADNIRNRTVTMQMYYQLFLATWHILDQLQRHLLVTRELKQVLGESEGLTDLQVLLKWLHGVAEYNRG